MLLDFGLALDKISCGQNWKTCFDWVSPLTYKSIYLVYLNGWYGYYDADNNRYLIDMDFSMGKPFCKNCINKGYTIVQNGDKYNILKIDGTLFLKDWVDWASSVQEGYFSVKDNGIWYIVSADSGEWKAMNNDN